MKMNFPSAPVRNILMSDSGDENEEDKTYFHYDPLMIILLVLKVVIWCLLMTVFIRLEFGAVFFVCSIFYFMFTNFRKTVKKPGELSAYSVFNPNCESIKGTLTAKQFERELVFGATSLQ